MMKRANVGKPKDQWKPPEAFKSALGKARDAARASEKKKKVASLESGGTAGRFRGFLEEDKPEEKKFGARFANATIIDENLM